MRGFRYALAIGDIDWFKSYNDSYGHLMGDRALTTVGEVFRDQLRSDDRCYRYGGEEFVILLREHTEGDAATALERVRRHTESLGLAHAGSTVGVVTISIGLAVATIGSDFDLEAWFKRADRALYEAKANGRNRVVADLDLAEETRRSTPPERRSIPPERRSTPPSAAASRRAAPSKAMR
jgi:diguanylate cyclase (GGDEF)-like protein